MTSNKLQVCFLGACLIFFTGTFLHLEPKFLGQQNFNFVWRGSKNLPPGSLEVIVGRTTHISTTWFVGLWTPATVRNRIIYWMLTVVFCSGLHLLQREVALVRGEGQPILKWEDSFHFPQHELYRFWREAFIQGHTHKHLACLSELGASGFSPWAHTFPVSVYPELLEAISQRHHFP